MNRYLKIVAEWLTLNKLCLNVDKTVFITFGNYGNSVSKDVNTVINNNNIKRVETCKYLGITFDS